MNAIACHLLVLSVRASFGYKPSINARQIISGILSRVSFVPGISRLGSSPWESGMALAKVKL